MDETRSKRRALDLLGIQSIRCMRLRAIYKYRNDSKENAKFCRNRQFSEFVYSDSVFFFSKTRFTEFVLLQAVFWIYFLPNLCRDLHLHFTNLSCAFE